MTTLQRGRIWLYCVSAVLISFSCGDNHVTSPDDGGGGEGGGATPGLHPLGLVEVTITGKRFDSLETRTNASGITSRYALTPIPGGDGNGSIQLELVSTSSFTEGRRGIDGVRYIHTTYRVRNASAAGTPYATPRTNLTFLAVKTASTIGETAVSRLDRFNETPANTAIASLVTPTGAVALNEAETMASLYPDVVQVYDEATIAALTPPAAVTNVFPYGFVVRNPSTPNSRTLPASPAADQFDGLVTFAFRVPMQADPDDDPFSISIMFLAVDDSETRVTQSLEENENPVAARNRAIALGGPLTVLPGGSLASAPAGSNKLCTVRVAGPAGSPTSTLTAPGAFTKVVALRPGESFDACEASFVTGVAEPAALDVPYPLALYARDRYGNTMTQINDSVSFGAGSITALLPTPTQFVAGTVSVNVTAIEYGTGAIRSMPARRRMSEIPFSAEGSRRVWTGNVSTSWSDGGNWDVGAPPRERDTIDVPAGRPRYPVLASNVSVATIGVGDNATIGMGAFNVSASGDVTTTTLGTITSSSGILFLTGTSRVVSGTLPRLRVMGRYSMNGNLTTVGPFRVELGQIRNTSYRLRINP